MVDSDELSRITSLLATDDALLAFIRKMVNRRVAIDAETDVEWLRTVVDLTVSEAIKKLEIDKMIIKARDSSAEIAKANKDIAQMTSNSTSNAAANGANHGLTPSFSDSEPQQGKPRRSKRNSASKNGDNAELAINETQNIRGLMRAAAAMEAQGAARSHDDMSEFAPRRASLTSSNEDGPRSPNMFAPSERPMSAKSGSGRRGGGSSPSSAERGTGTSLRLENRQGLGPTRTRGLGDLGPVPPLHTPPAAGGSLTRHDSDLSVSNSSASKGGDSGVEADVGDDDDDDSVNAASGFESSNNSNSDELSEGNSLAAVTSVTYASTSTVAAAASGSGSAESGSGRVSAARHVRFNDNELESVRVIHNELNQEEQRELFFSHFEGDRSSYCYQRQKEKATEDGYECWADWVNSIPEEQLAHEDDELGLDYEYLVLGGANMEEEEEGIDGDAVDEEGAGDELQQRRRRAGPATRWNGGGGLDHIWGEDPALQDDEDDFEDDGDFVPADGLGKGVNVAAQEDNDSEASSAAESDEDSYDYGYMYSKYAEANAATASEYPELDPNKSDEYEYDIHSNGIAGNNDSNLSRRSQDEHGSVEEVEEVDEEEGVEEDVHEAADDDWGN